MDVWRTAGAWVVLLLTACGSDSGDAADTHVCGDGICCAEVPGRPGEFRCSPWHPTSGDDAPVDSFDDGPWPPDGESGLDETGMGKMPSCGRNILEDGGFELGTPNPAWQEHSPLFGSPICDGACTNDVGVAPYAGDWFAWFGGATEPSEEALSQSFALTADSARLQFWFAIQTASGTGTDTFRVLVDDDTVFERTDADMNGSSDYLEVPLTLDQWADGQPHTLRFESSVGGEALTNFFVDDVSLVGCGSVDGETTGTTGGTSTATTGTGDSGTSDTGTSDTGSGTSAGSDSGSSAGTDSGGTSSTG